MSPQTNPSISVDCVVFGFDDTALRVLLVERKGETGFPREKDYKLPGSLIQEDEELQQAAYRVLEQMTGLRDIYLKQLQVFSNPARVQGDELQWLNEFYGVNTSRVVTVAYYALVKLNDRILLHTKRKNAQWADVQTIKHLALDHKTILMAALTHLNHELIQSPIVFELLPKRFTIRQLQNLYSVVLGIEIDSRNFRKKILSSGYIVPTDEYETDVAHKPAQFYTFSKSAYMRRVNSQTKKGLLIKWDN